MNTHKIHINSATRQNNCGSHVNLSHRVLSTCKMGQILPILAEPTIPGDRFNVSINQFARFMPLVVPAYVRLTYRTMSCFVPYHQIWDGSDSWFSNQKKFKGVDNGMPTITNTTMLAFFKHSRMSATTGSTDSADFATVSGSTTTAYKFTAHGNYVVKVLNLLGYQWKTRDSSGALVGIQFVPRMNALPLIAFAHAYNSYLSYSAFYNTSALSQCLEVLKRKMSSTYTELTQTDLLTITDSLLLTYEESFFSSAWLQPYLSNGQQNYDNFRQNEITPLGAESVFGAAEEGASTTASTDIITAQQVRMLLKFDEYFRRTNYAGSKDVEQIYSRFGVKIDDYKTRYPYFLGESAQNVQIGDVTSQADTQNAPIGAYAGKAISDANANIKFDCNDYGMLFTFAWFAPAPVYFNGVDKEILRLSPFDFYTPELDQGFASAIQTSQFNVQSANPYTTTFGYVPLYSEYLYSNDKIVGDFRRFVGMNSWHFGRSAESLFGVNAQDDALIYMPNSGTPFERIFNTNEDNPTDADSIYQVIDIHAPTYRPMKDFTGKTLLGEGNIDLPNMGSQIN